MPWKWSLFIEIVVLILNDAKINMFTKMVYFILQESLLLFNDKKERNPYTRYWFFTKSSSGCQWKCLVICWLFYCHFCFSFHLSYLCVITSNLTCPLVVILLNRSVFISGSFKNFSSPTPTFLLFISPQFYCVSWISGFKERNIYMI